MAPPAVLPLLAVNVAVLAPPVATLLGLKAFPIAGAPVPVTVSVAEPVTGPPPPWLLNEAVFVAVCVAVTGTVTVATSFAAMAAALVQFTTWPVVVQVKPSLAVAVPGV